MIQFDRLLSDAPAGALAGKAYLDRGWCLWEGGSIGESAAAFKTAASRLPHGEEQAVARFKLGDVFLYLKEYSNALSNFRAVLGGYADVAPVQKSIFPHTWYNVLRCSIELNDLAQASEAMGRILKFYPQSPFADRSMLLLGQQLSASKKPAEARQLFADFADRFPESALLPKVELAVARTYQQENKWAASSERYEKLISRYPSNELQPRVEFDWALAYYHTGQEKMALPLFTNFLARFPTNQLAPLARYWLGDFYYGQGGFPTAEEHYQLLYQNTNWIGSEVTYQARMMAGRAAFARQAYRDATNYFLPLVNDTTCPPNIVAEALYALGDTMISQETGSSRTATEKFDEAKNAFKKIIDLYPTNDLVPRAWGRIGDCYRQMASYENRYYESALEAYQKVISDSKADTAARSLANIGMGDVLEAQAKSPGTVDPEPLLKGAFDHYYDVFAPAKRPGGGKVDLFYFKIAALGAARVAEERKQWDAAINIYNELMRLIPGGKGSVERKIERVEQLRGISP